jgi:hypothetical protein
MQHPTTQPVLDESDASHLRPLVLVTGETPDRSRIAGTFQRMKTTLDGGESGWTPVLLLASGYAITIPAFLLTLALAELAYHLS